MKVSLFEMKVCKNRKVEDMANKILFRVNRRNERKEEYPIITVNKLRTIRAREVESFEELEAMGIA